MNAWSVIRKPLTGEAPLWRVLVLYLPGGTLALAVLAFALIEVESLFGFDPGWAWLVWTGLLLAWVLASTVMVWRCARRSHPAVRYPTQVATVLALLALVGLVTIPHGHDYGPRMKVYEGVNLSAPARVAIGIACAERDMRPGADNEALGLLAPEAYAGPYTHAVRVGIDDERTGRVVITMKAIPTDRLFSGAPAVADRASIIYTGTCTDSGITWTVGGTVPKAYRPRG